MSERAGFSANAHRYLDGGPHGPLDQAERAAADRLAAAAQALGATLAPPDASLEARVMAAVRTRPAQSRERFGWRWLVEPRVGPVWIPVAAAAAALVVWVGTRSGEHAPPIVPVATRVAAAADTVYVRFELLAPDARGVGIAGSFNAWSAEALPMLRGEGGIWAATVALPIGEHQYQFVVDGQRWLPDPTAHAQVDDGYGGRNSVIVVSPKGLVRT
jgi:hypothetical protein